MKNLNYIRKSINNNCFLRLLLIFLLVWTVGCPQTASKPNNPSNNDSNNKDINENNNLPPKKTPPPETITQNSITYIVLTQDNIAEKLSPPNIDLNGNYILWEDIDLTGSQIAPIGDSSSLQGFKGKFNGNGKKLSHFSLSPTSTPSSSKEIGFFARIDPKGKISNLIFENPQVVYPNGNGGAEIVGTLAGSNKGTIQDVTINGGRVKGGNKIGGLVGQNSGKIISSRVVEITIQANQEGGGITGNLHGDHQQNPALILKSSASGKLISDNANVFGGLVGAMEQYSKISMCAAHITINEETHEKIGGLVGVVTSTKSSEIIENSYATGILKGKKYVGGLIGKIETTISITHSYAITTIESPQDDHGLLVGRWTNLDPILVKSLYFDKTSAIPAIGSTDPTNQKIDDIVKGLDKNKMTKESFVDFDFSGIWKWTAANEWPRQSWESD